MVVFKSFTKESALRLEISLSNKKFFTCAESVFALRHKIIIIMAALALARMWYAR
jgi:hypothetical protein